jgi:hypothetical protein
MLAGMNRTKPIFTTAFFLLTVVLPAEISFSSCKSNKISEKLINPNPAAYNSTAVPGKSLKNIENSESINGKLPEHIFIATLTQAFAHGYEFCISGGRIMMKKKNSSTWNLFLKTGLPFSQKMQLPNTGWFLPPESITEIAADDDTLIAFDNFGRMYVCPLVKNHFDKKFEWSCTFGWPEKKQLVQNKLVENKRGWATATRRSNIKWYTDRFGNEHHWGTMGVTTVYFLTKDGREIRFTDSGLPADFSDTILGPARGSFTAENISASGSTVFLIDKTGTMFTRLIDYDTMGCDPMFFKYTYVAEKQPYKGSDYRSNFTHWGLPNEDWHRQPQIPLMGKARLTKHICIFQNGKGNDARVLRVAGLSPEGHTGYYWKNLTDIKWQFEKAPLVLTEGSFLPESERGKIIRGNKNEYSYTGVVLKDNTTVSGIVCSIDDMTLTSEGSCTLKITKGTETKQIPLYLVEMWTYMTRYDPVFDNTPKSFFVTPHFDAKNITSSDAGFNNLLSDLFQGRNLELFSATATAAGPYLTFNFRKDTTAYTVLLHSSGKSEQAFAGIQAVNTDENREQNARLDTKKTYTAGDIPLIDAVAEMNRQKIAETNKKIKRYKEDATVTGISRWGYTIADTLAALTLLKQVDMPKIKTMTSFGGRLMSQNADNFQFLSEYKSFEYPYEIQLAENTITECTNLKRKITENGKAETDALFRSDYQGYFDLVRLPQEIKGTVLINRKTADAVIWRINTVSTIPALLAEYDSGKDRQYIIIEFTSFIADVHSCLAQKGNAPDSVHPFTADVVFHVLSAGSSVFKENWFDKYIVDNTGTFTWDGTEVHVTLKSEETNGINFFISDKEINDDD